LLSAEAATRKLSAVSSSLKLASITRISKPEIHSHKNLLLLRARTFGPQQLMQTLNYG